MRLQFIHVIWLVLTAVLALASALGGTADSALLAGLVLAALPGIVGATLLHPKLRSDDLAGPFLVIGWTLLAMLGIAATGATLSPLTILFAIAPLTAMNLGKPGMAAEAAIFGAFAFVATAVMVRLGLLPPANPAAGYQLPAMLLAFAGLVMTGFLAWTFLKAGEETAVGADAPVEPVTLVRPDPGIPAESGLLLIDASEFGRIRTMSGDLLGLDGAKAGGLLANLLQDETETSLLKPANGRTHGEITLKNGREVAFVAEAHEGGSVIVLRDLTEVRARTLETRARLEEAEARLKGRTAFFASLGHDLKTPLNAILGYADMMRAGIRGPMPEPYADYPEIIHESGQDLLLLVEDILDLAKAEADRQRLEPEPVDLTASAQSVLRQLDNQAERAGVKLKLKATGEVWAEADARAVRQIWQNLVSNAIKYSESGGTVTLDARDAGNATVLSVTDKGAGMTPEDVRRVLEPFSQGSNAKGRKGTGLGLAVVNSFAQLHGGQVVIDSAPGRGTKVEVSLPRADPADIQPLEDAAQ
ncbi:sensor histidine kinase KdpD [Hyphomonas sp.]|uniref:sensor histidine kinase n=1 Tax=Hyphomonas sp. TaxID=87 RepID=UPI0025C29235|nr:HAMP domain-containing sensor histidine kinase [Hyphomonas sp.]